MVPGGDLEETSGGQAQDDGRGGVGGRTVSSWTRRLARPSMAAGLPASHTMWSAYSTFARSASAPKGTTQRYFDAHQVAGHYIVCHAQFGAAVQELNL